MDIDGVSQDQLPTWVVSQAIRNQLQYFHGAGGIDPDNPESGQGFISDAQMRALNIVIRCAVHEALGMLGLRGGRPDDVAACLDYCRCQLSTVRAYMEAPGSPELRQAYRGVTTSSRRYVQHG
jgi:hypothetical protein